MLLSALDSLGFFASPERGAARLVVAFLFALLLGCKGLAIELVDLIKLIAAMAEPLLSCLACTVRKSSCSSASQQNSQAWTSRDRPRDRRGGTPLGATREFVRTEIGGRVTGDDTLWLRCKLRRRIGPRDWSSFVDGTGARGRGGDEFDSTTSALPSRENDNRILEDPWLSGGRIGPADLTDEQLEGTNGSRPKESSPRRPMVDGVENELLRFHALAGNDAELEIG